MKERMSGRPKASPLKKTESGKTMQRLASGAKISTEALGFATVATIGIGMSNELSTRNTEELAELKFEKMVKDQKREVAERISSDLKSTAPDLYKDIQHVKAVSMPKTIELLYQDARIDHPELNGLSQSQYLERHFLKEVSEADIPMTIQKGLRYWIDGLVSWESGGNKLAIGYTDDIGAFQAKPSTLSKLGWSGDDRHDEFLKDFTQQVDFANLFYLDLYRSIVESDKGAVALNTITRVCFDGDEEAMQEEFLVYVVLNGHNAGPGQMVSMLDKLAEQQEKLAKNKLPIAKGFGVFDALRKLPDPENGYNEIEREYVVNLMGTKEAKMARSFADVTLIKGNQS